MPRSPADAPGLTPDRRAEQPLPEGVTVRTETFYRCGICGQEYREAEGAAQCYSRGVPEVVYPVGMIYGNASSEDHHQRDMTFAVGECIVIGHSLCVRAWACRDTCNGDNGPLDGLCGGHSSFAIGDLHVPDREHPTFKRMVGLLKAQGIPVTVWDGEKAVPLDEGD